MSGAVPANPRIQFPSSTGGLLPGGFVDVFTAGTTTRATTWQDKALTTPNQNPIALDTAGSCSLWTDSSQTYDFVVRDANLVSQYTLHNIVAAGVAPTVPVFNVDTFSGNGSQTAFTLSATPAGINNTDVYVSGVYQKKSAYSLTGSTLNFVAAPASGTNNIEVNTFAVTEYNAVVGNLVAQVTAATTQATAAAASRTAIDDRLYPGTFSVAPTLRPDGTAIQNGDRYVNSTDTFEYIRVGGSWSNAANQTQAAQVSATQAANYAAAAATGAKFFNTIALGNAGVADAATFGVIAGGSDGLTRPSIYRRESAGVSTLLYAVLPALEYDKFTESTLKGGPGGGFVLADPDGNVFAFVEAASGLEVSSRGIYTKQAALSVKSLKYRGGFGDGDGNLVWAIDSTGAAVGSMAATTGRQAQQTTGTYDYDINFYPMYGQSESVGQAAPAVSTTQKYDNLMFTDGMRPQYDHAGDADAVAYAAFVPAVEVTSIVDATLGETPNAGAGEMIKQLIASEDGLVYTAQGYQILHSSPGFGSTSIAGLSKGTTPYTRLMTQVTYGFNNAAALNKSFALQAVGWWQGVSDFGSTQAAYYASMNTLVANINTDAKAITGQTKNIYLLSYQIASQGTGATPIIALAQLQASQNNALIRVVVPMYIFNYQASGNPHLVSASERIAGAYMGLAYKRFVIDGQTGWQPLQPISSTRSGKTAYVKFHVPVGKLVLDTTLVSQNTNYGFELFQADGVTPITISSVSLRGSDTVVITAAAAIPSGGHVHYAWTGTGTWNGRQLGPRGNLRDQQGENFSGHQAVIFDPNGANYPLHNWAVISDTVLP